MLSKMQSAELARTLPCISRVMVSVCSTVDARCSKGVSKVQTFFEFLLGSLLVTDVLLLRASSIC